MEPNAFWVWLGEKGLLPHGGTLYHNPSAMINPFKEYCLSLGLEPRSVPAFELYKDACERSRQIGLAETEKRATEHRLAVRRGWVSASEMMRERDE